MDRVKNNLAIVLHLVILCREEVWAYVSGASLNFYGSERCFQDHWVCTEVVFQICVCFTVRPIFIHFYTYRRGNSDSTNSLFSFLTSHLTMTKSNLSILQREKKTLDPNKKIFLQCCFPIQIYVQRGLVLWRKQFCSFWISQTGGYVVRTFIS